MHIFQSNSFKIGWGTWRTQAGMLCLLLVLSNSGWSGRVVRGAAPASMPPTRPPQDLAAFIAATNEPSRSRPVVQPVIVTDLGVPHTLPQAAGLITPTVAVGLLPVPVGFSGAWTLPDATLYLRSRVYQPSSTTTRFVQRDTFAGFAEQPQSGNRYSYAWGNPVLLTDPTGNCPLCVAAAGGAAIGAGIEGVRQIIETGGICDWGQIGKAGLAGGIGGLGAAGLGLGLGTSLGTGLLGAAARGGLSGGLGGGLGQAVNNGLNGRPLGQGVPEATALGGGLGAGLGALGRAGSGRSPALGPEGPARLPSRPPKLPQRGFPQGPKTTFAGHGEWEGSYMRVPPGTQVTVFSTPGSGIRPRLVDAVELYGPNGSILRAGSKTFGPGAKIPDYTLHPAPEVPFRGSPVTVKEPTKLSDLLQQRGPGNYCWGACTPLKNQDGLHHVFDIE